MNGTAEMRMDDWAQVSGVRVTCDDSMTEQNSALDALTRRYRGRGFVRAAKTHLEDMDAMEQEARAIAPAHYRWDELCANGRGDQFRHATYLGRQVMDVDDFATYFAQCRADRRAAQGEESVTVREQEAYVPARTREQSRIARLTGTSCVATRQQTQSKADRLIAIAKEWLQPDHPALRRVGSMQRVPVSLISFFVVIAVSLMLVVSSSVMVAGAKRQNGRLEDEVAMLQKEAGFATDKLESHINYLDIYRTATEEYGMIPAAYVNSVYVSHESADRIEVAEQQDGETVGLSTLLSAIGIHIEP